MSRPLEPHDGVKRRYTPELSVFHGPAGLEVPVCTFDGDVKTLHIEDRIVSQIFDAAFPAFKAGEAHYRNADLLGGRYRRYAGSSETLDAGSYSSVARWSGHDDGGLVREIFAYTDPAETGLVMIDDMTDARDASSVSRRYRTQLEAGEYLLLFVHESERLMTKESKDLALPRGALPNMFKVPCVTRHARQENVVDLRLPAVQAWFFKTFSDEEWLNIHVPLPPVRSFLDLLVVMLGQYRGGNVMTQAVGRELRLWGIGGLIYPSARCDCAVVVENGDVIDWYGWNFVDYETTRRNSNHIFNPMDAAVITKMTSWEDFVHGADFFGLPMGQIKINYSTESAQRGTWQVKGLESLNVHNWIKRLTSEQRLLVGLPADAALVSRSRDALNEVERRLSENYSELVKARGAQAVDIDTLRGLLARLARELAPIPGGGRAAINVDTMAQKLDLGELRDAFVEIGVATGMLVEEFKGYVRFDDPKTLEYFTTVGSGHS